ncbi:MAG: hypothetical protein V4580_17775 [Bacteroidota bacterium]
MKKLSLFFIASALFLSCKKEFNCKCYSDRRGAIIEQYTHSYKEKKKDMALSKCKTDYENSNDYVNGGYCEIK